MRDRWTEADFEQISWHDCHLWGLQLAAGDPDAGDWTSDLVLDIDYITEWICPVGAAAEFRVAPATLTFHGVGNLGIRVHTRPAEAALHPWSIGVIERAPDPDQRVFLDRVYYRWHVRLNWPADGEITFGAAGFTQQLREAPVATSRQHLTRRRGRDAV
jgi:hypothetical protein